MAADPDQLFVNGTAAQAGRPGDSAVVPAPSRSTTPPTPSPSAPTRPARSVRATDLAGRSTYPARTRSSRASASAATPTRTRSTGAVRLSNSRRDDPQRGHRGRRHHRAEHLQQQQDNGPGHRPAGGPAGHRRQPERQLGRVSNSIVSNNNTENFKDAPVSGGIKFTSARTMTVKNVEANNNLGSGIWFDVSSYNVTIVNNTANGNTKHGIEVEVSDTGSSPTTRRPTAARTASSSSTPAT